MSNFVIFVAPKSKSMYIKSMIAGRRVKSARMICLFGLWLITLGLFAQEATSIYAVPDVLRRPERGEAPRYPDDLVIGELGQGEISDGAYLFARNVLSAITEGRRDAAVLANSGLAESLFEEVRGLRPRSYRLGGGRNEADGCVSFLVRLVGPVESLTGELYLRSDEASGRWLLDDLILEEKKVNADIRDSYRFDFSPYERFF